MCSIGTQPLPKRAGAPLQFLAHVYCGQTAGWIKLALGMEVAFGGGHIVQKGGRAPQFSAHFYCRQMAGCIKMLLGMEVGLGPGDFVFDGDPATTRTESTHHHPVFGLRFLWPNGWMDEDATWYGSRPRPRPHCILDGVPLCAKGAQQPPPHIFSAHVYCGHGRPSQLLLSSCYIMKLQQSSRPLLSKLSQRRQI